MIFTQKVAVKTTASESKFYHFPQYILLNFLVTKIANLNLCIYCKYGHKLPFQEVDFTAFPSTVYICCGVKFGYFYWFIQ